MNRPYRAAIFVTCAAFLSLRIVSNVYSATTPDALPDQPLISKHVELLRPIPGDRISPIRRALDAYEEHGLLLAPSSLRFYHSGDTIPDETDPNILLIALHDYEAGAMDGYDGHTGVFRMNGRARIIITIVVLDEDSDTDIADRFAHEYAHALVLDGPLRNFAQTWASTRFRRPRNEYQCDGWSVRAFLGDDAQVDADFIQEERFAERFSSFIMGREGRSRDDDLAFDLYLSSQRTPWSRDLLLRAGVTPESPVR